MPEVYGPREGPLNQGDLLVDVPFYRRATGEEPEAVVMLGLVTTHSCDLDKYLKFAEKGLPAELLATWPVSVAPVHSPDLLTGGQAGDARAGRMPRYFHLPADEAVGTPEYVTDLWQEQPVPRDDLVGLDCRGCLGEEWRRRLLIQIWISRSRLEFPPEPTA